MPTTPPRGPGGKFLPKSAQPAQDHSTVTKQYNHDDTDVEDQDQAEADASTEGQQILIQKLPFTLPDSFGAEYVAGHVLTANEAIALRQAKIDNLRNAWAPKVKKAKDFHPGELPAEAVAKLQQEFHDYALSYEFSVRGPRQVQDPVGHEAAKMAKGIIMAKLKEQGYDSKTLAEGQLDSMVEALLAKRPEIRQEAQRRVDQLKAVSEMALGDLGLKA